MDGRRPRAATLAALVLTAAVAACSGATSAPTPPRLVLASCTVQGVAARCGTFKVAENPADASGRKLSLRVVVVPATTSDRARDSLFYFTGGPGGAASLDLKWVTGTFGTLRDRHDIVFIDQRGTGGSNNVTCSGSLFAGLTSDSQIPQATQSCLEEFAGKADPRYYTTAIAVDDFDQVRQALGYDRIDIYGVSYGVSPGLAYVQRHGDHVRAAVFDSGSLLDVRLWQSTVVAQQSAMNRLFAQCHADAACEAAFPKPEADFQSVIARLSRAPVELNVLDPSTGDFIQLGLVDFLGAVADHYLGSTPARAVLLRDIHRAAAGDWTAFTQLAASQSGISDMQMMALTVKCSDEWAAPDQKQIGAHALDSAFTPLVLGQAKTMNLICGSWPKADGVRGRVQSAAPIVFLNGTSDPNDPPENVAGAETDMPNSLVVPVQGTGHWQLAWDTTGCLAGEAATFLALGQRPAMSQFPCASTVPLPAFVVS